MTEVILREKFGKHNFQFAAIPRAGHKWETHTGCLICKEIEFQFIILAVSRNWIFPEANEFSRTKKFHSEHFVYLVLILAALAFPRVLRERKINEYLISLKSIVFPVNFHVKFFIRFTFRSTGLGFIRVPMYFVRTWKIRPFHVIIAKLSPTLYHRGNAYFHN